MFQRASQQDLRNRSLDFPRDNAQRSNGRLSSPRTARIRRGDVRHCLGLRAGELQCGRFLLAARCAIGAMSSTENGWLPHVAPQILSSPWGGTLWSSAPLTAGWETYRTYGDKRLLDNAYPTYKKWMEFLNARVSNGILTQYIPDRGKFLGDWAAPGGRKEWGDSKEALLFNNCVYALDLKMMIDIATALDKREEVALYAKRLDALRKTSTRTSSTAKRTSTSPVGR